MGRSELWPRAGVKRAYLCVDENNAADRKQRMKQRGGEGRLPGVTSSTAPKSPRDYGVSEEREAGAGGDSLGAGAQPRRWLEQADARGLEGTLTAACDSRDLGTWDTGRIRCRQTKQRSRTSYFPPRSTRQRSVPDERLVGEGMGK